MTSPSAPPSSSSLLPLKPVTHRVKVLHGLRVSMDADLAALYGVENKRFNEAVKRNAENFPADFRYQLTSPAVRSIDSVKFGTGQQIVPLLSIL